MSNCRDTDAYGCEAPRFMDFEKIDQPEDKASIEAFFDRQNEAAGVEKYCQTHEAENEEEIEEVFEMNDDETDDTEFYTPVHNNDLKAQGRLSISMVCLSQMNCYEPDKKSEEINISDSVKNLNLNEYDNNDAQDESKNATKPRGRSAKLTPRSNKSATLRARSNSGTRLCALAKSKEPQAKFISTQEAINKFERGTPTRFHSKPKGAACSIEKLNGPLPCTIACSPALATKDRHRPVTSISTAELELKQYEEAKKFKIKANPVNRKILGPVKPLQPIRKSPTHPQPFHLTEVKKAAPAPVVEGEKKEFHARPAPACANKVAEIKHKVPTQAITPNVMKRPTRKVQVQAPPPKPQPGQDWKNARTVVQPFSFERRDKILMEHKEKKIQMQMEAERKQREFHSRPMPTNIYKEPSLPVKLNKKAESMESVKSCKSDEILKPFKARPPVSLMKEPFVPKKVERPLLEVTQFELNTEKRMREREEFNEKIRERERQLEYEQRLRDEARRQEEEEIIKENRKKTVYIANPIKKYKDLPPVEVRPITTPVTPHVINRYKNKENLAQPLGDSYEE